MDFPEENQNTTPSHVRITKLQFLPNTHLLSKFTYTPLTTKETPTFLDLQKARGIMEVRGDRVIAVWVLKNQSLFHINRVERKSCYYEIYLFAMEEKNIHCRDQCGRKLEL